MKKRILKPIIATFVLTVVGHFGIRSYFGSEEEVSPLLMQNIEALTQFESQKPLKMQCNTAIYYTGGYSMPLYCKTCSFRYGWVATGSYSLCP